MRDGVRIPVSLVIYVIIMAVINLYCNNAVQSGEVHTNYNHGFSVDHEGNLYLGFDSEIQVTDPNGNIIRTFSSQTSRGYTFKINDSEQILLSTGSVLYTMDLYGTVIEEKKDDIQKGTTLPHFPTKTFTDSNGVRYEMKEHFLRIYIYRLDENGSTAIYEMPLYDYYIHALRTVAYDSLIIMVPIFIWRMTKLNGLRKEPSCRLHKQ